MTMVKMTNEEALELLGHIDSLAHVRGDEGKGDDYTKFRYACARNGRRLRSIKKDLEAAIEPSDEYRKYDADRMELAQNLSLRKPDKTPTIMNGQYVIDPDKKEEFDKGIKDLKKKHKKAVDEYEQQQKGYKEILNEDIEVDLHFVNMEFVPQTVGIRQMEGISMFLKEEDEKEE